MITSGLLQFPACYSLLYGLKQSINMIILYGFKKRAKDDLTTEKTIFGYSASPDANLDNI